MAKVKFLDLWKSHPYPNKPCDDETFPNQCAIRMGVALEGAGVDTNGFDEMYPDRRCYSGFDHSPKHILAAQELANWLKKDSSIFGKPQTYTGATSKEFKGIKGIVFIKNGWGATDHIDLWNGTSMKGGYPYYFELGKEVWFWELSI